jgi:hypothetical protein
LAASSCGSWQKRGLLSNRNKTVDITIFILRGFNHRQVRNKIPVLNGFRRFVDRSPSKNLVSSWLLSRSPIIRPGKII